MSRALREAGRPLSHEALAALSEKIFAAVAEVSRDGEGVTRPSYGEGESRAIDVLVDHARKEGLAVWRDAAANVFFSLPGEEKAERYLLAGSHMDSVPQGGNYDGLAGVVAGLLVLVAMKRNGEKGRLPLHVIGLRGEESAWFGRAYLGSKALTGQLTAEDLAAEHRENGRSLGSCMQALGADVGRIEAGERLIDLDRIAAYIELHIEQGPVLVDRKWPVATVTGIRGNIRHRHIRCIGEAGHSGAVPKWLRRDAVFATAQLLVRLDDHWTTILQHGDDLVLTSGILYTDQKVHAMSRIPGDVTFSFEARSQKQSTLDALHALLKSECETLEQEYKIRFEFDAPVFAAPAAMNRDIIDALLAAMRAEGLPAETVPSGAGHDASVFANQGVPSGMIFVRNYHGSHNAQEHMDVDDFAAGLAVLRRFVTEYGK